MTDKRNYLINLICAKYKDIDQKSITFTHDARVRKAINVILSKAKHKGVTKADPMAWCGDLVFMYHDSALKVFELDTKLFSDAYGEGG